MEVCPFQTIRFASGMVRLDYSDLMFTVADGRADVLRVIGANRVVQRSTNEASRAPWAVRLRASLPTGTPLPEPVWRQRHRGILVLLWLHVPVVFVFGLVQGVGVVHAAFETAIIIAFAAMATGSSARRRISTVA